MHVWTSDRPAGPLNVVCRPLPIRRTDAVVSLLMRWNSPSAPASSVTTWGGPSGVTIVTDHVTELPSAREISLTTSFGDGSPGGRVDCARFQCHRPTNGRNPLTRHWRPARHKVP